MNDQDPFAVENDYVIEKQNAYDVLAVLADTMGLHFAPFIAPTLELVTRLRAAKPLKSKELGHNTIRKANSATTIALAGAIFRCIQCKDSGGESGGRGHPTHLCGHVWSHVGGASPAGSKSTGCASSGAIPSPCPCPCPCVPTPKHRLARSTGHTVQWRRTPAHVQGLRDALWHPSSDMPTFFVLFPPLTLPLFSAAGMPAENLPPLQQVLDLAIATVLHCTSEPIQDQEDVAAAGLDLLQQHLAVVGSAGFSGYTAIYFYYFSFGNFYFYFGTPFSRYHPCTRCVMRCSSCLCSLNADWVLARRCCARIGTAGPNSCSR